MYKLRFLYSYKNKNKNNNNNEIDIVFQKKAKQKVYYLENYTHSNLTF